MIAKKRDGEEDEDEEEEMREHSDEKHQREWNKCDKKVAPQVWASFVASAQLHTTKHNQ